MKAIAVLFYVEPVCFRQDPLFLKPFTDCVAAVIAAHPAYENMVFGIASSPFLCRALRERIGTAACREFSIDPRDLLETFAFDRHAYGRDLYADPQDATVNDMLVGHLRAIDSDFVPDVVISFSQNRYIESLFAGQRLLFMEMGPLPRAEKNYSYFLDPRGHQSDSLLNTAIDRIRSLPVKAAAAKALTGYWQRLFAQPARKRAQSSGIAQWIEEKRQGRPVALLAMQVPDWLTYEAAYDPLTPDAVLMRWLNDLPPSWMAIASHHPLYRMPAAAEAMLAELYPSFYVVPERFRDEAHALSEDLMSSVDGVVTISSAVAMTAVLCDRKTIVCGRSYLNGLCGRDVRLIDQAQRLTPREKAALMMFLSNFYCRTTTDIQTEPGCFAHIVRRLVEARDPLEPYFDFAAWTPENFKRLLVG